MIVKAVIQREKEVKPGKCLGCSSSASGESQLGETAAILGPKYLLENE